MNRFNSLLLLLHVCTSVTCFDFEMSPNRVVLGESGTLRTICSITERNSQVYSIKIKRETSPESSIFEVVARLSKTGEAELDSTIKNDKDFTVSGDKTASPPYLEVTMNIQKLVCSDAMTYMCEAAYEDFEIIRGERMLTLRTFVLPSMTPPIQARKNGIYVDGGTSSNKTEFDIGDELELTCEANIGSLETTLIKWRKTSERDSNFAAYEPPAGTFSEGTALSDNQCGYTRTATMRYNMTKSDVSYDLAFECYVTVTGYPLSSKTPSGVYETKNNLQYHLHVSLGTCTKHSLSESDIVSDCSCPLNVGAFVGVAIGSVLVTLVAVGLFFLVKRLLRSRDQADKAKERSTALPDIRQRNELPMKDRLTAANNVYINEGSSTEYASLQESTKDVTTYSQLNTV